MTTMMTILPMYQLIDSANKNKNKNKIDKQTDQSN